MIGPTTTRLTLRVALCFVGLAAPLSWFVSHVHGDRVSPPARGNQEGAAAPLSGSDEAMSHFFQRLAAVESGRGTPIARVAFYGESTNAADRVSSALRRRLQERFGDAGKGFVPAAPGWRVQRHQDVRWNASGAWQNWVVNRRNGPNHHYGLAGVLSESRNATAETEIATVRRGPVGKSVSRFTIFYQAFPDGGQIRLDVDGGHEQLVSATAESVTDRTHEVTVDDGAHALHLGAGDDRPIRLYGVAMERDQAGVVVDGLMLVGAFTRVLGQFDATHWQQQIATRDPDLLVFWFGGNDATSHTTHFSRRRYVSNYARSVNRARAGKPEASCLIVSVLDSAEEQEGQIRTLPRIPRVVAAQETVADQTDCAFLNLYEAAGGYNTMVRWRHRGFASGDHKHLTRRGAQEVGRILYEALLSGYDTHVASNQ